MDIPFYAQDKKAKKKAKKQAKKEKKHRKRINRSHVPQDDVTEDLKAFNKNRRDQRQVQKHDRNMSMKSQILAQGMLWPGTPEYEAKIKEFREFQAMQQARQQEPMIKELEAIEQHLTKE